MPALRNFVSTVAAACTTKPRSKSDPSDHPLARTLGSPSSSSRINASLTRAFKTRSRTISSSSDFGCTGAMEWDRYYNSPDGPGSAFPSPMLSECTSPCSPLSMPTTPSTYSPHSSASSPKSIYSPITPVQEDPFKEPAGSAFPFPTFKTPPQIATLDQHTFPVTPVNASKASKRTSPPSPSPAPLKREQLVRGIPLTRLSVHNGQQPTSLFEDHTIATFCSPPLRAPSRASSKLQSLQEEEDQDEEEEEIDDEWSPKLGMYSDPAEEEDDTDKLSIMVAAASSPRVDDILCFSGEVRTRQESWVEAFKSLEQESAAGSGPKSADNTLLPSPVIKEKAYPAPMTRASCQALVSERIAQSDKAAQAAFSALFSQHSSPKAPSDPSPKLSAEEQWLENASLQMYDGTIDFEARPVLSTSLLLAPLALKRRIAARAQKELERLEFANKALPPLPSTTQMPIAASFDGVMRPRSSSLPNILQPPSKVADWPVPESAEEPIVPYCESKLRNEVDPLNLDDIDVLMSANWSMIIPQPATITLEEAQEAVSTTSDGAPFDTCINGDDPFVDILPLQLRKETSSPKSKSKKAKSKTASPSSSPVLTPRKKAVATEFVTRSMEIRAEKYWVPPTGGRKVRKYSKSLPASTVHIEARVRNAVYAGGLPC